MKTRLPEKQIILKGLNILLNAIFISVALAKLDQSTYSNLISFYYISILPSVIEPYLYYKTMGLRKNQKKYIKLYILVWIILLFYLVFNFSLVVDSILIILFILFSLLKIMTIFIEHRIENILGKTMYSYRFSLISLTFLVSIIVLLLEIVQPYFLKIFILINILMMLAYLIKNKKFISKIGVYSSKVRHTSDRHFNEKVLFSSLAGYALSYLMLNLIKVGAESDFVRIATWYSLNSIVLTLLSVKTFINRSIRQTYNLKIKELLIPICLFLSFNFGLNTIIAFLQGKGIIQDYSLNVLTLTFLTIIFIIQYFNSILAVKLRSNKIEPVFYANITVLCLFLAIFLSRISVQINFFLLINFAINTLVSTEIFFKIKQYEKGYNS